MTVSDEMARQQTRDDLVRHLGEQCGFLIRSAELFDAGDESEAKRIAVVIRTLVHDTKHSQALLDQLELKQELQFVALNYTFKPGNLVMCHGLVAIEFSPEGPRFIPHLDRLAVPPRRLAFGDWWNEPVLGARYRTVPFSRRDLVLALANKEGGAHVDPELDEIYSMLARKCDFGMKISYKGQQQEWTQNPFLPSVRQIGHEMLHTLAAQGIVVQEGGGAA